MDPGVGTGTRLKATGELVWELSGAGDITAGAKSAVSFAVRHADDASGAVRFTRSGFRRGLAKVTGGFEDGAHAHHMFPLEFAAQFERVGLNANDPRYGAWWAAQDHLRNARGYNESWRKFLLDHPDASPKDILQFGQELAGQYGLKIQF